MSLRFPSSRIEVKDKKGNHEFNRKPPINNCSQAKITYPSREWIMSHLSLSLLVHPVHYLPYPYYARSLIEQWKDSVEWLSVSILFPPHVEYFTLPSILNLGMSAMEGNFVSWRRGQPMISRLASAIGLSLKEWSLGQHPIYRCWREMMFLRSREVRDSI